MSPQLLLPLLGGVLLFYIIRVAIRIPGKLLAAKFKKQGNMTGMSEKQIISNVGGFQSIQHLGDGRHICIWQETGYMIAINFDANGIFAGINSETFS